MFISQYDIYIILPEIYLLTCICFLLVYGVLMSTSVTKGYPLLSSNIGYLSLQVTLFAFLIVFSTSCFNFTGWNSLILVNSFTQGTKFIVLGSFIFWFFLSLPYTKKEKINSFEYWLLSLLSIVGMLLIVQCCDLISMYLSMEFQSLVFYILASFKRTSEFSTESGLKYFVLGAFSSALLLFGSSVLYSLTGLTNFNDYLIFFSGSLDLKCTLDFGIITGLIFINTALLFKLSAAPFHMWSPDVYEGAPTSITAFFSILPKLVITSLLLKLCLFSFHDFFQIWQKIVFFCSYLSILIGTLLAFSQTKWKRFIAYSSINHVGFILMGLSSGELESIFSVLFYVVIYIITMFALFFFLITIRYYHYPRHYQIRYMKDLTSLATFNPVLALTLTTLLFSMAGIPPLAGFFAKLFVLLPALQNNLYGLTIFAVLMSCVACFYYIRLIKIMYFNKVTNWIVMYPIDKITSLFLGLFYFLTTFIFIDLEIFTLFLTRMSLPFLG